MSTLVVPQKTAVAFDNKRLTAHAFIDKLAVIVGHCELLSEHVHDGESLDRLNSIARTAKFLAEALHGQNLDLTGAPEWTERGDSDTREQDHNFE